MKISLPLLRRRVALFGFSLAFLAFAAAVHAGEVPTFSDPDVTAFAKDYSTFMDQYAAVMKEYMAAAKANDTAKTQASATKMQGIQTKGADLQTKSATLQAKVKPEEEQKFSDFMQMCAKKLTDATQQ